MADTSKGKIATTERPYTEVSIAEVDRETNMAMLVEFPDTNEKLWVPKSITRNLDVQGGTIEVQDWWLKRNGLL